MRADTDPQVAEAPDRSLRAELHVLAEKRADVEHRLQQVAVARCLGDREMEIDVCLRVAVGIGRRRVHPLDRPAQMLDLLGRRALGRERRQLDLDDQARLRQLLDLLRRSGAPIPIDAGPGEARAT